MNTKDKKLAVLHLLSQSAAALSLPEVLEKLDSSFPERSVRRWLLELVEEGLVSRTGQKRGTKYTILQRSQRVTGTTKNCFSDEGARVIAEVMRPLYERTPVTYNDAWIESYQPNITFYIPEVKREQLQKAGERSLQKDPAGTYAHQIFNRLLIDLSYNSSRLEGNTYSLLDTQKLVLEGASAEGKYNEETIMILNHKEAIRYLVYNAFKLTISEETICTLHYLLSDGLVEISHSGKLRSFGVRVGGSAYIPIEGKNELQIRFERILQKASQIENPFEQSFFLLVHISYLQGFADVNKRTARLSANISLVKNNLVPLSFNDVEKEDYLSAVIAVYELQNIRPLLDLYFFSYLRTCALYDNSVKNFGFDEIRVRYRQQRRALVKDIILKKMTRGAALVYISQEAENIVKDEEKELFIEDTLEDLRELDVSRIAGLGVTLEQVNEFKKSFEL